MTAIARIVGGLVLLGAIAVLAMILVPASPTGPLKQLAANYQPEKGAGEAAARAADCAACHTSPGGKPFAGGREMPSPFGPIYATNITPDPKTGIGAYSLDEFRAALYDGVRKDGARLYPAMPYANYRKLSEEDVRALYAYFMKDVAPVSNTPPETRLSFPFNQRWAIRAWTWLALPEAGFKPHMGDPVLDRGAYLVEGPGHCGACHTPRNALFAEKGYDSGSAEFLTGATIDDWPASDLRAKNSATQNWPPEELGALLRSGRNTTSGVSGEMALVVEHSLQHLPETDIAAIAAYLKAIRQDRASSVVSAARAQPASTAKELTEAGPQLSLGARLYLDNCNACHFAGGQGAAGVFPRLDGNDLVIAGSAGGLLSVILDGTATPSTASRPARLIMPGFGWRLSDEEAAALATFVRQAWSNNAGPVTLAEVAAARKHANPVGTTKVSRD